MNAMPWNHEPAPAFLPNENSFEPPASNSAPVSPLISLQPTSPSQFGSPGIEDIFSHLQDDVYIPASQPSQPALSEQTGMIQEFRALERILAQSDSPEQQGNPQCPTEQFQLPSQACPELLTSPNLHSTAQMTQLESMAQIGPALIEELMPMPEPMPQVDPMNIDPPMPQTNSMDIEQMVPQMIQMNIEQPSHVPGIMGTSDPTAMQDPMLPQDLMPMPDPIPLPGPVPAIGLQISPQNPVNDLFTGADRHSAFGNAKENGMRSSPIENEGMALPGLGETSDLLELLGTNLYSAQQEPVDAQEFGNANFITDMMDREAANVGNNAETMNLSTVSRKDKVNVPSLADEQLLDPKPRQNVEKRTTAAASVPNARCGARRSRKTRRRCLRDLSDTDEEAYSGNETDSDFDPDNFNTDEDEDVECLEGFWSKDVNENENQANRENISDVLRNRNVTKFGEPRGVSQSVRQEVQSDRLRCPDCERLYANDDSLQRHHRRMHSRPVDAPTFTCHECQQVCRSMQNLERHMTNAHSGPQIFGCDQCTARFGTKRSRALHRTRQHPEVCKKRRPRKVAKFFECQLCDYNSDQSYNIVRHFFHMHTDQVAMQCLHGCGRTFKSKANARVHMSKCKMRR